MKNRRRKILQPIKYVDKSSLISIPVSNNYNKEPYYNELKLALVNRQSIKTNNHLISYLLDEQNIDIFAVTETSLTYKDPNTVWLESTILNTINLKMQTINRQDRHDGRFGLIYRSQYNPQHIDKGEKHHVNLKFSTYTHKKTSLHIVLIYHPIFTDKPNYKQHIHARIYGLHGGNFIKT